MSRKNGDELLDVTGWNIDPVLMIEVAKIALHLGTHHNFVETNEVVIYNKIYCGSF
jgi:hypothetical protein